MRNSKPTLAVSGCLLGDTVRYDGKTKQLPYLINRLSQTCELIHCCPEVAIGMGVPRPPIQIVEQNGKHHARGVADTHQDVTDALHAYAQQHHLSHPQLSGYILKSRSPSCGTGNTPIYNNGNIASYGDGLFAQQIQQQAPLLPIINEDKLADPLMREYFLERVFIYHACRQCSTAPQRAALYRSLSLTRLSHGITDNHLPNVTNHQIFIETVMASLQQPAQQQGHLNACREVIKQLALNESELFNPGQCSEPSWKAIIKQLRPYAQQHDELRQQHYLFPSDDEQQLRFTAPIDDKEFTLLEEHQKREPSSPI